MIKSWNKIYPLWTALREEENLVSIARRKISVHFLPLPFSFSSCSCTTAFCLLLLKSHFPSASVFSSPNFTLQNNTFKFNIDITKLIIIFSTIPYNFYWLKLLIFGSFFLTNFLKKILWQEVKYSNLPFRFNFKSHHTIVDTV